MRNLLVLLGLISFGLNAQTSKVYDNLKMHSKILNMDRNYAVYLPPDYETSERSYPVLYLLHGATDDHTGWVQFGEIKSIADKAIRDGIATSMIVIMPDADTRQMGYTNAPNGWNYEDFFFEELMPFVEDEFRIKKQKRYRAIAGLSMGGGGTFYYALHKPYLFGSACPLSASTGPLTLDDLKKNKKYWASDDTEKKQKRDWFENYSTVFMMENLPVDSIKSVRWYIDCGDDDFLFEGNSLVHMALRKRKIPHEYRVRDGNHNWTYWRQSLPEVLRFVSDRFHQK